MVFFETQISLSQGSVETLFRRGGNVYNVLRQT